MTHIVSLLLIKLMCYYYISLDDDEYSRSHFHMSFIGPDCNAAITAPSMNLPHNLLMASVQPPHCYNNQVVNDQGFTLNCITYIVRYLMYLDQVPLSINLSIVKLVLVSSISIYMCVNYIGL